MAGERVRETLLGARPECKVSYANKSLVCTQMAVMEVEFKVREVQKSS